MIYNFDTEDKNAATAALIVYVIYRSRNTRRFKVSTSMWGQIERFVKASAKRATNLPRFIDSLMPRFCCESISPRWTEVGALSKPIVVGDSLMEFPNQERREFLTDVIADATASAVLDCAYKETTWVVMLVRDRLEREKPIEKLLKEGEDDA